MSCRFEANEDETHRVAAKRKHNELAQQRDELQRLFAQIAVRGEADAADILRRIRSKEQPSSILRHLDEEDALSKGTMSSQMTVRQSSLLQLLQSSAPLDEVLNLIRPMLNDDMSQLQYMGGSDLTPLWSLEVTRQSPLTELVRSANSKQSFATDRGSHSEHAQPADGKLSVPAGPWVSDISDEDVTELVSVYFDLFWPYWRFVERDLFLESMRSGRPESSLYCSPFLVNCILALASVSPLYSCHMAAI